MNGVFPIPGGPDYCRFLREKLSQINNDITNCTCPNILMQSTVNLGTVLDSISIMCNADWDSKFKDTPFENPVYEGKRLNVLSRWSKAEDFQEQSIDFWTVHIYWEMYGIVPTYSGIPFHSEEIIGDFQMRISKSELSGPLIHDIIMPTWQDAVAILDLVEAST